ncbi:MULTISPECIES: hypothetical protein [Streptomyces]|uniref:hypothetical protein n=1 Tax=Streptomyces TaxID=1883 RepID=UPI00103DCABA|nr:MULTISPECIES: hypothetical protein [Streptomyces]MBT3077636.1 hypothetical protein [Streptomyces sp. COG21]MBT3084482.1 hypothetical protein [Streptomyces sp. COG20]MBT3085390.1 hypothetical protein [Streptomyces sp. CYG21]MBT3098982.1 hypothetical protein [Streptomyces sp. CBG30]MBT3103569.1 hypothetical protein [Streptomyces sp. COG19]
MTTPAPAAPEGTTTDPGTQPATPPNPPAAPPAPAQPEPTAPTTAEPSEPNQPEPKAKAPKFEGDFDPARFEKLVENLRGDVAAEKAKREALEQKAKDDQDALMKRVATAFGLETDEAKPPTPEELAKQLEEARGETKESRAQARQTQVELAVYKTAGKHGGDPDALLDSRSFATAISKLDPTAADFDEQVGKAVKTAVDSNSKLAAKAPQPKEPERTPAGGAPMDGAGGGKRQLGEADRKRMTPDQIAKAVKEGRFAAYLGGGG